MQVEHTESVVDRAVAFVKEALGLPPGEETPNEAGLKRPEAAATQDSQEEGSKGALELNAEAARREDGE